MAGHFELIDAVGGDCQVRLVDAEGTELALSMPFHDKDSAAKGIYSLREIAASGLVEDHTASAN
ncbi:YegP family protein [Paenarthrobacter sp. NPDC089675]|uniref:YegP family protein n=1 Tax=Paenarthrobacter sp. NPDC089675 TaxID=3364376 RepID=UPI0038242D2D